MPVKSKGEEAVNFKVQVKTEITISKFGVYTL
jgi:hypothetical protein